LGDLNVANKTTKVLLPSCLIDRPHLVILFPRNFVIFFWEKFDTFFQRGLHTHEEGEGSTYPKKKKREREKKTQIKTHTYNEEVTQR
jgi:hypothetical protein